MWGGQKTTQVEVCAFLCPCLFWGLNSDHHKWPCIYRAILSAMKRSFFSRKCLLCRIKHLIRLQIIQSVKCICFCVCLGLWVSVKDKASTQQYMENKETCKETFNFHGIGKAWQGYPGNNFEVAFHLCNKMKDPRQLSCCREVHVSSCQSDLKHFQRQKIWRY